MWSIMISTVMRRVGHLEHGEQHTLLTTGANSLNSVPLTYKQVKRNTSGIASYRDSSSMELPSHFLFFNPTLLPQTETKAGGEASCLVYMLLFHWSEIICAWLVWMFLPSSPHRKWCWMTEQLAVILEKAYSSGQPGSRTYFWLLSDITGLHPHLPRRERRE